jgi:hypothetical protein
MTTQTKTTLAEAAAWHEVQAKLWRANRHHSAEAMHRRFAVAIREADDADSVCCDQFPKCGHQQAAIAAGKPLEPTIKLSEWEEREAACCPEDVPFEKVIEILRREKVTLSEWVRNLEARLLEGAEILSERDRTIAEFCSLLEMSRNEVTRLTGLLRVSNTERNDAKQKLSAIAAEVAYHECGCEVCAHTNKMCPATASSYAMLVIELRQQIHDLCHDKHVAGPVTPQDFCDGCEAFQVKLFGTSPIAELRAEAERLRARVRVLLEVNEANGTDKARLDRITLERLSLLWSERAQCWIVQAPNQVVGNLAMGRTPREAMDSLKPAV